MPLDFPNTPSNGSTYTADGVTWQYDGEKWIIIGSGTDPVAVSASPPTSPGPGDAWFDTDSGTLLVYYDGFWVAPSVNYSIGTAAVGTAQIADANVTTAKIADGAVTNAKLGPTWTSFTPTLTASTTNPTAGTGNTRAGRYIQIGKMVTYQFYFQFGSAGMNPGSGIYRLTLPVTSTRATLGGLVTLGTFRMSDTSANLQIMSSYFVHDADTYIRLAYADFNTGGNDVTNALPWTWAAGDEITGTITYEAA